MRGARLLSFFFFMFLLPPPSPQTRSSAASDVSPRPASYAGQVLGPAATAEQQRPDLAEAELAQVAVIEAYLPKALTPEELEAALRSIIAETGATSAKEMGKVMGVATKRLAGRADGKAISTLVRQLLA